MTIDRAIADRIHAVAGGSSFHDSINGATDTPKPPEPGTFEHALAVALADVENALGASATSKRGPLFYDSVDLLQRQFDGARWLVTGLITRGGIVTIGGVPKAAKKTWFGTELAIAVATGTKVCGEFFAQQGTVAYFYAEDGDRQVQTRIRALLAGADRRLAPGRLYQQPRGEFIDITRSEDLARIVASCRRFGKIDLLILDPLRDVSSAAEDKSDEMSPVMRRLRLLGELLECTVAVVHHAAKPNETTKGRGGGARLRGSGAIHGSTDSGIYFLDCKGDGRSEFKNLVESEIKGARSAGLFVLDLSIEDNDEGEAVRATWKHTKAVKPGDVDEKPEKGAEPTIEEAAFGFVRDLAIQGVRLTRTGYKNHEGRPPAVPAGKMIATLDRLIERGRLRLDQASLVQLPALGSEADS